MVGTSLRDGFGALAAAPFNRFAHSEHLADHRTEFVSVNNDTVYSIAQLDLSGGPLRLHVPDTGGAYYVLQFVDAWTNNFAYVGRRATGTGEGEWLIVPPGWSGSVPDGVRGVIDAPTAVVTVAGRNACDGPGDLPRVRALQEQLTLTPLDGRPTAPGCPRRARTPGGLRFFEELRVWMADFPPSPADQAYQDRSGRWGCWRRGPRRTPPRTRLSSAR
ncbi:ATP synthase subunit alpha OS=Streptomyces microflavus OX=1919 GN=Smic_21320 PE=4 SV=1 [Streptomyces microflavus]